MLYWKLSDICKQLTNNPRIWTQKLRDGRRVTRYAMMSPHQLSRNPWVQWVHNRTLDSQEDLFMAKFHFHLQNIESIDVEILIWVQVKSCLRVCQLYRIIMWMLHEIQKVVNNPLYRFSWVLLPQPLWADWLQVQLSWHSTFAGKVVSKRRKDETGSILHLSLEIRASIPKWWPRKWKSFWQKVWQEMCWERQ